MTFLEQILPAQLAEALVLRQQRRRGMVEITEALSILLKKNIYLSAVYTTYPSVVCYCSLSPVRPGAVLSQYSWTG